MATAVVSGRIDEHTKSRAGMHIRSAGLTAGDVIKTVWENIARTGEVPVPVNVDSDGENIEPMTALYELRKELSKAQRGDDWLGKQTKEQMRDMIAEELMEKYGYA